MTSKIRVLIAARALVLAVLCVGGCTVDQIEPPTTTSQSGEPQTTSGASTSGASTGDGTTGTTGDDPTGGPVSSTGAIDCEGPNGCFDCPPSKPEEFLNACSDATCEPFPNTKERLPLLNDDGTLPPLP